MRAVVCVGSAAEGIEIQERADPRPAPGEVLVEVPFAALNPADLEQRAGRYPAPPGIVPDVPGLEVAGRVRAVGGEVGAWAPGDRVFGLVGGGGLADRVVADPGCLTAIPTDLTDEEAAAIPEAFITAHDALLQGGLGPGATVMVRGASGAVGSAAVQIAARHGATVCTPDPPGPTADDVREAGATPLGELGDLVAAVREHTGGRGLDLVVELLGASTLPEDLRMLASRGTIVVVGLATGTSAELDLLRLMRSRATIRGTVLRSRPIEEKREAVAAFARDVVPGFADGSLSVRIDSVFGLDDVRAAFRRQGERGKGGKVVLRMT